MFGRYRYHDKILSLNPETDYEEIVQIVGQYEAPWIVIKALEFALFRTYAVPHTSRILRATGQFQTHGQKRYDDTTLMLAGIAEHGINSEFGQTAISHMNRLHGMYNLRNEDMKYVLSTFMLEPTRWSERYGWRKPTRHEKLANYYFWKEVGRQMGITDIPETYEAADAFNKAHEAEYFKYDDANRAIGLATVDVFLSWYPLFLRPIVREGLYAMMDDPLLESMALPKPHGFVRLAVHLALKARAWILRVMPPRTEPFTFTTLPNRTYPDGFDIAHIGAHNPLPLEAIQDKL